MEKTPRQRKLRTGTNGYYRDHARENNTPSDIGLISSSLVPETTGRSQPREQLTARGSIRS